jgi:5S rRNA maturation endonuclease (ribonuclease M5)
MIDAITCWVYGKPALALNGTGNDLQFKQLSELPCRCLILATDMDEAGLKARERIKQNVKNKIIKEYIWDINMAKDINDMSKEQFNKLQEYF